MRLLIATAAASVALVFPTAAGAAPGGGPASITGTASAEVIAPISVRCPGWMRWGTLASRSTPATVTMNPAGTPLDDPDDVVVPGSDISGQPAHCDVEGEPDMTYLVTLPTGATLTHSTDGTKTMTLTDFTISTDEDATPGDPLNRTLVDVAGVGVDGFQLGATLHVGADQTPGYYKGTFVVSVNYN